MLTNRIFNIQNSQEFKTIALEIFQFQAENNKVYKQFIDYLNVNIEDVSELNQIPFLPIQFFKSHKVVTGNNPIIESGLALP